MTTGLTMLDVAIGLILMYLLLSLLCSSISEALETVLKNRSRQLERGIREILDDPDGSKVTHLVYNHPLISGLFQGDYHAGRISAGKNNGIYRGGNLPSYIPSANFALAVLDILLPATGTQPSGASGTIKEGRLDAAVTESLAGDLRIAATRFPVPKGGRALVVLIDASSHDLVQVRESIEYWFNSTMDRVSGWYKRRVQVILFCVAVCLAASMNLDSIAIGNRLAVDPALRSSLIATATEYAHDPSNREIKDAALPESAEAWRRIEHRATLVEHNLDRLNSLGLPLGWQRLPVGPYAWFAKLAGLLATALAASLGAPFWFDLLNRFMVVRSTIKPREK